MIVGVLTTCRPQYTWDRSICVFLFNRTTLHVFVTYLTGALYVHPLWFYKHQHDNRFRSKLSVACQRWWFQWRFWFVPSVPGYTRSLSLETVHITFEWNCHMVVVARIWCGIAAGQLYRTTILNNPLLIHSSALRPSESLGLLIYRCPFFPIYCLLPRSLNHHFHIHPSLHFPAISI